jgi:hypothetical protein
MQDSDGKVYFIDCGAEGHSSCLFVPGCIAVISEIWDVRLVPPPPGS